MKSNSAATLFQSFQREAVVSNFSMVGDVHSLTLSVIAFSLQTKASLIPQGALKVDFEEAIVERDMPEPC